MLAGIRDILLISTPEDMPRFAQLLGDGGHGVSRSRYAVQPSPEGLAQAFIIGRDFVGGDASALVLGDNIFYGHDFSAQLRRADARTDGATVFAYPVPIPSATAWSSSMPRGRAVSLEEKPAQPKSSYAVTGLYFYDNRVLDIAARLSPPRAASSRSPTSTGPTSSAARSTCEVMGRGMAWLDTGTHESLLEAGQYIATIEQRQGLKIACPEEIAFRLGYIDAASVERLGQAMAKNGYGQYLLALLREPSIR